MNGEFPSNNPRAELEARLTAFILGELPAHDAAALRQAMDEDAELAALYERLKAASKLVREAVENPIEQIKEPSAPLRLSEERRQKLLAPFKTVVPREFVRTKPKPSATTRLLEVAAVLAAMGILSALLLPALSSAKYKAKSVAITYNLRQIDGAKLEWAEENHKPVGAVPTMSDLAPYLGRGNGELPKSIEGETYNIGRVGESPTADIKGKRRISLDEERTSQFVRPIAAPPRQELVAGKMGGGSQNYSATTVVPVDATPPVKTSIFLPPAENLAENSTSATNGYVDNSFEWNTGSGTHQPKTALPAPAKTRETIVSAGQPDFSSITREQLGDVNKLTFYRNLQQYPNKATASGGTIENETNADMGFFSRFRSGSPPFKADGWTSNYSDYAHAVAGGDSVGFSEHPQQQLAGNNSFAGHTGNLPAGQRPDVDSIHAQNPVVSESSFKNDGLLTNQGVGAWELSVSPTEAETDRSAGARNSEFRFYNDLNGNGIADTNATLSGEVVNLGLIQGTGGGGRNDAKGLVDPTTGLPVAPLPVDAANNNNGAVAASTGPSPIDGVMAGPRPLSEPPPQVNIKAKFADVTQDDQAMGLNWGGGNFTNRGNIAIARLNTDGSLETEQSDTPQGIHLTGLTQIGGEKQALFAGESSSAAGVDGLTNLEVVTVSGTAAKTGQPVELSFDSGAFVEGEKATVSGITNAWHGGAMLGPRSVTLADGSVQQFTVNGRRTFANQTADTTAGLGPNVLLFPGDEMPAAGKQAGEASNLYTLNVVGYINLNLTNPTASAGSDYSATNGVVEMAMETAADEAVRRSATRKPVPTLGDLPQLGALFRSETNAVQTAETNHYFRGIGALTQRDMRQGTVPSQELIEEVPAWRSNGAAKLAPEFRGSPPDTGHYTNDLGNVTVSVDPDSKRVFFITDADTAQSVSNVLLNIDRNGGSNPPNVVHYNSLRIDSEAEYARQEKLLKQLKDLDKEKLKETLAAGSSDPIMSGILQDKNAAKESLEKLKAQFGPTNPEVQRKEKEIATLDREADDRAQGVLKGLEITTKTLKEQAQKESKDVPIQYAKASDISEALKTLGADGKKTEVNKLYREKQEELDGLMTKRNVMAVEAAQADSKQMNIPTTSMAEVIDRADGGAAQNHGFRQRIGQALTGKVTETARIKIGGQPEVTGFSGQPATSGVYDPYFMQTEFEVIQSEKVLDQVIERLNLDGDWAAQKGSATPLKRSETRELLKKRLQLTPEKKNGLVDIKVQSDNAAEAAKIANTIAEVYTDYRRQQREGNVEGGGKALNEELAQLDQKIAQSKQELAQLSVEPAANQSDSPVAKPAASAPVAKPEVSTSENAFSTFSLNIADVSFKLAAASLEKGRMPEAASIRSEEFINAFDYRDPEPAPGAPLGFAWERAQYPFAHNRDLLRFAVKTAAAGREPGRPLNIVLLLDKSGSMERADRVKIIHEALRVLATQLQPQDRLSVVTFARVARLWVDGLPGSQAGDVAEGLDKLTPEGGTNLEEAMRLAYETARRHYLAGGINRVVLLTDGAANLGNVEPESLKQSAEEYRKEGIALDCFGVGWEGYNDDLMEVLSRNGGGRYGFLNTPEEAATGFAAQLAGALNVAAYDVKVQVEFNPKRVTAYRQIGYAKQQLTKEQFRDNTVKAAQVGAAESGNALYAIEVNANGEGPVATVRVRYRVPGTEDYPEHEWVVPYDGNASSLGQASPAMRLAGTASAFSEWLALSPFAGDVTTDRLLELMRGVPEIYGADERPKKMEWMIRQAKSLEGK